MSLGNNTLEVYCYRKIIINMLAQMLAQLANAKYPYRDWEKVFCYCVCVFK